MSSIRLILLMFIIVTGIIITSIYYYSNNTQLKTTPTLIRLAVLPDVDHKMLHQQYNDLLLYLSRETNLKFELVIPADYADLEHKFNNSEVEIAYFGGLTFVRNYHTSTTIPLVMRSKDTRLTSVFFTSGKSDIQSLSSLKQKSLTFGSKLSTSGHLMPRHFLETEKQILADKYFSSVSYSGAHDKTAYLVRDGEFDVGVANKVIINNMISDGRLHENDIKIIWETPPFADYIWVIQGSIPDTLQQQLKFAFLNLDTHKDTHKKILKKLNAQFFIPVDIDQYDKLRTIADELELLK